MSRRQTIPLVARYTSQDGFSTWTGDGFRATDGDFGVEFFWGASCAETKARDEKRRVEKEERMVLKWCVCVCVCLFLRVPFFRSAWRETKGHQSFRGFAYFDTSIWVEPLQSGVVVFL